MLFQAQYCGFDERVVVDFINRHARANTQESVLPEVTVERHIVCHQPMKHVQVGFYRFLNWGSWFCSSALLRST